MVISATDKIKANILEQLEHTQTNRCGVLKAVSVPEVIVRINEALDDDSVTVDEVAKIVCADAVLTARILRVANSPLMCHAPVTTLMEAIRQIGVSLVRSLAVYVMLQDRFEAKSKFLNDKLHDLTKQTAQVAATMYVMCKTFTTLNPDMATLIGLIHNIGAMATINYIDEHAAEFCLNEINIDEIIEDVSRQVGSCILHKWGIPTPIVDVVVSINNATDYDTTDLRTYKHIFHTARLHSQGKLSPMAQDMIDAALQTYEDDVEQFTQMFG